LDGFKGNLQNESNHTPDQYVIGKPLNVEHGNEKIIIRIGPDDEPARMVKDGAEQMAIRASPDEEPARAKAERKRMNERQR